jgi:hypothetical protein
MERPGRRSPHLRAVDMSFAHKLVLQRQRHLKWKALDPLEAALMILCGRAPVWILAVGLL